MHSTTNHKQAPKNRQRQQYTLSYLHTILGRSRQLSAGRKKKSLSIFSSDVTCETKRALNEKKFHFQSENFALVYFSSLAFSTTYRINEKRVLLVLIRRNFIAMNELIVVEIEDENFGRAKLR